jgi:FdhD protein
MEIQKIKKTFQATKHSSTADQQVRDDIVVEEALQININGKPYTVTMRTPGSDQFLVRGLLYTEGIYNGMQPLEVKLIDKLDNDVPSSVGVWIPHDSIGDAYFHSRSMLSVSSCGICGKKELSDLAIEGKKLNVNYDLEAGMVSRLFSSMKSRQKTFMETGGSHAAAAFTRKGELLACEEDIGRHNAVDKVIGSLLSQNKLGEAAIMLVSGRISYEIVSKTFKAGIPYLAAVSSPSSLAIETADAFGISLMAFCRADSVTCYTHPERVIGSIATMTN